MLLIEQHLKLESCVGIKLYPGYNKTYITDESYEPVYGKAGGGLSKSRLLSTWGQTAGPIGIFKKYSHPLTMDGAAVRHPDVPFVMCHFKPVADGRSGCGGENDNVATRSFGNFGQENGVWAVLWNGSGDISRRFALSSLPRQLQEIHVRGRTGRLQIMRNPWIS